MILKQDAYILYSNINAFENSTQMRLHLHLYKTRGSSSSAVSRHCVLVSRQSLVRCQCLITSTTVIHRHLVCRQCIFILSYVDRFVTVINTSALYCSSSAVSVSYASVVSSSQCRCHYYQHKSQFSQSHSQ